MSKTLVKIGIGVGLFFLPIGPIVSAIRGAGYFGKLTTFLKVLRTLKTIGGLLALSGAASILRKKPNIPNGFGALAPNQGGVNPRQILCGRFTTPGAKVFEKTHNNGEEIWQVFVLGIGPIEGLTKITTVDGKQIPINLATNDVTGEFAGLINVYFRNGSDNQTAFTPLTDRFPSQWTTNHRLRGLACVCIKQKLDQKKLPSPLNFLFHGQGLPTYDPRKDTTVGGSGSHRITDQSTWEYAENVPLFALTYLIGWRNNGVLTAGVGLNENRLTHFIDEAISSANVADESVATSSSTEPRYQACGVLDSAANHQTNLEHFEAAMVGHIAFTGKGVRILAGAYRSPVATLTNAQTVQVNEIKTIQGANGRVNTVRGQFANAANDGKIEEFPAVVNATAKTADGEEKSTSLTLPLTPTSSMSQRLAQVGLNASRVGGESGRFPRQVSSVHTLEALRCEVGDVINLSLSEVMDGSSTFRVEDRNITVTENGIAVALALNEEDSASVWGWAGTDDQAHNPTPNLNSDNEIVGVDSFAASGVFRTGPNNTKTPGVEVTWTAETNSGIDRAEIDIKPNGETDWVRHTAGADAGILKIFPLEPGQTYSVRLRFVSANLGPGDWSSEAIVVASTEITDAITVYRQTGTPATTANEGSLWIKTDTNEVFVLTGGAWVSAATNNNVFYQTSAPSGQSGDFWYDTNDFIWYTHVGGGFQPVGNNFTNTSQLTDDAGLGDTAIFRNVTGRTKIAMSINEGATGGYDAKRIRFYGLDGEFPDRTTQAELVKQNDSVFSFGGDTVFGNSTAYSGNGSNGVYYLVVDTSGSKRFDHTGTTDTHVGVCRNLGASTLEYFRANVGFTSISHDSNMIVVGFCERRANTFVNATLFEPTAIADAPDIYSLVGIDDPSHLPAESVGGVYTLAPSNPCTGHDNGSSARIDIASTTLHYGDNSLTYSSGSVTSLSFSTGYHVYVVDDSLSGGSLSHQVTTSRTALPARHIYLGYCETPANSGAATGGTLGGYAGGAGAFDRFYLNPF